MKDRKTALPLPLGDAGKALKEDSPSSSANQRVPAWHEEKSGLEKGSKYDLTAEMPQRQSANNRRVIRQSLTHRDRVNETHTAPHRAARRSSCSSLDVSSPRFVEGVSPRVNPHYLGLGITAPTTAVDDVVVRFGAPRARSLTWLNHIVSLQSWKEDTEEDKPPEEPLGRSSRKGVLSLFPISDEHHQNEPANEVPGVLSTDSDKRNKGEC